MLIGGTVLLSMTVLSVLLINDLYVAQTVSAGHGITGTMTITATEPMGMKQPGECMALGTFVADRGDTARAVQHANDCSPTGTQVRVDYVPSLRERVGLPVPVAAPSQADVMGALTFALIVGAPTLLLWVVFVGFGVRRRRAST